MATTASRGLWAACLLLLLPAAACAVAPLASVNIVDLFWRFLADGPGDRAAARAAAQSACGDNGFLLVRFAALPYWPAQAHALLNDTAGYWAVMDAAIGDAAARGCTRLVPSLFWNPFTLADLHGEPLGTALRAGNASRAYRAMREYAAAFAARYATHSAIAAFEVGNEWNLLADLDLDNSTAFCAPALGTPPRRSLADNVSSDDVVAALGDWAAVVRAADALGRPVSCGHSLPRPAAEHLRRSYASGVPDWTPDSAAELRRNLRDVSSHAARVCCA